MGNEVENIDKGSDHVQCDKKECVFISHICSFSVLLLLLFCSCIIFL